MVFSFYYTDKIALMVQENNPIMQQIKDTKPEKEEDYVNAIINDDKIIPGKNGLTINVEKSFSVMKSFNAFNSYYLIYDQKKPKISLEDNKDKIITSGNLSNNNMTIIVEYSEDLVKYLESNNKSIDDYDGVVLHQANKQIVKTIAKRLNVNQSTVSRNIKRGLTRIKKYTKYFKIR